MADGAPGAAGALDCAGDPVGSLATMFVDIVQGGRIARGQCPARRPVFLKPHGIAHATFEVRADLPQDLRVGVLAGGAHPAWVRFSSDTVPTTADFKTTLGLAIKLFDVPGAKLAGDPGDRTFDILLQNHDVFFVDAAADMCAFTKAGVVDGDYGPYLRAHPETARVLDEMAKPVASVLASPYWSVIPFAFGPGKFAKYKLEPDPVGLPAPSVPTAPTDPGYLAADLAGRLATGEARFRFLVQFQVDAASMPLDRATVRWDEALSPPVHVADLVIPQQDVHARGQAEYGENLAMNPWRVTTEHAPQGSIAAARRGAYAASADRRRDVNGIPTGEPERARPAGAAAAGVDDVVVRAAIHPGIGVARVGDSADGFFVGPEVTDPPDEPVGAYRDGSGALKRQATRFRIFGYDAAGSVVRELTAEVADIRWTVHLANKKAAWYRFLAALDLPEAAAMAAPRRNASVAKADRSRLAIDPGPRSIAGASVSGGPAHAFDTGTFKSVPVPLGELRTDEAGRLLVLGGHGRSGSPSDAPILDPGDPGSFSNADDWFDDVSDGPVDAAVTIDGRAVPVTGAWVAVCPPNYAPGVVGWRTLHDMVEEAQVLSGSAPLPARTSFAAHVLPLLRRLSGLQWVNKGFAAMFGKGGPMDFGDDALVARLGSPPDPATGDDPHKELRQAIFNAFRPFDPPADEPRLWPWIYGDAFGSFVPATARNSLALPSTREVLLRRWVAGDFDGDWAQGGARAPLTIEDVALQERPAMLDRAALHFCLADAFHPGCELTWPMRHATMYAAPFRIRRRLAGAPEPDHGPALTQKAVLEPGGPLYGQGPGDLTRWMAVPWQGDSAGCRSGYEPAYDPYVPTFWPARVPNQVLAEEDYLVAVDAARPRAERLAAFARRRQWFDALTGPFSQQMRQMVDHFGAMGLVEPRPGVSGDPDLPDVMLVASAHPARLAALAALGLGPDPHPRPPGRLGDAGWRSEEELQEFRRIRSRRR